MFVRNFVSLLMGVAIAGISLQTEAQVVNHEASGNLQSNHALACIALDDAKPDYTPADLYPAVAACIVDDKMVDAVNLMVLAGAYGRFDRLRVADGTAHQATTVLQMQAYADLPESKRQSFMQAVEREVKDPVANRKRCMKIDHLGPPKYRPDYMIPHGMGAFTGKYGDGLVPNFDSSSGWNQVRTGYLECPSASSKKKS